MKDLVQMAADAAREEGHLCVCGRPATGGIGTVRLVQLKGMRYKVWGWLRLTCTSVLVPDPDRPGIRVQDCSLLWQERGRPKRTAPEFRLEGRSPHFTVVRIEPDGSRSEVEFPEEELTVG